jgi:hypothetical protein
MNQSRIKGTTLMSRITIKASQKNREGSTVFKTSAQRVTTQFYLKERTPRVTPG